VKLLGFGLVRLYGLEEKPEGALAKLPSGMLEYLAPELMRGGSPEGRADLYGLGALLYEMVTGVPPYAGSREAVERKKQAPPQSPRLFRPDLSADLEQLILRLLDPEPGRRPGSVGEVATELEGLSRTLGPAELAISTHNDDERRRVRREAAFRVIAVLEAEVTGGPQLLDADAIMSGGEGAAGGDASRRSSDRRNKRTSTRPPPPPPSPNGSGAALAMTPMTSAGGALPSFAPPMPMGRALSGPSVLTSALGPAGHLAPPAPALGGGVLARYGVAPGTANPGRRRVRGLLVLALVAATAALAVKLWGGGSDAPPPSASGSSGR
jgi:serine/threonine protein kinase